MAAWMSRLGPGSAVQRRSGLGLAGAAISGQAAVMPASVSCWPAGKQVRAVPFRAALVQVEDEHRARAEHGHPRRQARLPQPGAV